jgi:hypothetical protein
MKKSKLTNRLEIRVNQELLKELDRFCKIHRVKQSRVLRDAVRSYLQSGSLKYLLMEYKDPKFRSLFKELLSNSPIPINQFFENLLAEEEVKMVMELPLDTVEIAMTFITSQGKKAYLERCSKGSMCA